MPCVLSVPAPTGHRGQTGQTGAEQEHGGGFGDGSAGSTLRILRERSLYSNINITFLLPFFYSVQIKMDHIRIIKIRYIYLKWHIIGLISFICR